MVMSNPPEKDRDRKMFVGIVWNCAAEFKFLLVALLLLCSLATVFQFLSSRFSVFPSDIRHCLSGTPADLSGNITTLSVVPDPPSVQLLQQPKQKQDQLLENGVIKRAFNPYGSAAYNFILMSAYRGGVNTFAVMGLSSKPLHDFGKPSYQCQWIPDEDPNSTVTTVGQKILTDWGYGRVYTVVVVNCTFPTPTVTKGKGGKLLIHATTNGGGDSSFNTTDTILALNETAEEFANFTSQFSSQPKYDYLYCGSSLYGNLSPQRVREWLAYHVKLLGSKSHFVIHDAGGVHDGVMEVLKPWMEKGFVTLQDIRDQERFDGYYHNQFLIVNDCLHRYRFAAKWMLFFDVDEFIFMPKKSTIQLVFDSFSDFTQFTIEQMPMSNKLCLLQDARTAYRKWGFEKLVYKDVKKGIRRDRKYAVQPRNVFATGVHMSQNTIGKTTHKTEGRIKYFHYHGTISDRREPCQKFVNSTQVTVDRIPYVLDTTMRDIAGIVKRFELKMIGTTLQRTRQ
ncbi:galactan beta-1,4-galactosyltransferase GALS2-like [Olea europaea var. sylvestris]|uniref:galactan beta-1,4-galactosyltransferase GALS2-like n=1 Tax=Olea europaea var. sylvestris TaxID=158386 RepID=UPI000C1D00FE|nr:galactan beta-1,4-galactosyltransferase GALS2-like [Olea europaea var. sylvestris]